MSDKAARMKLHQPVPLRGGQCRGNAHAVRVLPAQLVAEVAEHELSDERADEGQRGDGGVGSYRQLARAGALRVVLVVDAAQQLGEQACESSVGIGVSSRPLDGRTEFAARSSVSGQEFRHARTHRC